MLCRNLHDRFRTIFCRTAERYRSSGRFAHGYVSSKLRRDPVHIAVLSLATEAPFGNVIDIGCGRGQLAIVLLEAGVADAVLGYDLNHAHLRQAEAAARELAFRSEISDLSQSLTFPVADTVLMIDILYQLTTSTQLRLLEQAAAAARSRILIRTADPACGWRSTVTRWLELLVRRFWPHSGARVNARPIGTMSTMLVSLGFTVSQTPCWQGTPFANILLDGRRNRTDIDHSVSLL